MLKYKPGFCLVRVAFGTYGHISALLAVVLLLEENFELEARAELRNLDEISRSYLKKASTLQSHPVISICNNNNTEKN